MSLLINSLISIFTTKIALAGCFTI
uniref:Uncharacterized protein n=1 Tax=Rhizophora mucronata TaxID=61149 RepID=A0A2P2IZC1_RHIMU